MLIAFAGSSEPIANPAFAGTLAAGLTQPITKSVVLAGVNPGGEVTLCVRCGIPLIRNVSSWNIRAIKDVLPGNRSQPYARLCETRRCPWNSFTNLISPPL